MTPIYWSLTTGFIHEKMIAQIQDAVYRIRKAGWREGTEPQERALEATQQCSLYLEQMYEDYLKPHIAVIRKLNIHCDQTLESIKIINTLKNKGIIAVLKMFDPELGKNVPVLKKYHGINNVPVHYDDEFGAFGVDWLWAQIDGTVGKVTQYNNAGYAGVNILGDSVVSSVGHDVLNGKCQQQLFNELLAQCKKKKPNNPIPVADEPKGNFTRRSSSLYDAIEEVKRSAPRKGVGYMPKKPSSAPRQASVKISTAYGTTAVPASDLMWGGVKNEPMKVHLANDEKDMVKDEKVDEDKKIPPHISYQQYVDMMNAEPIKYFPDEDMGPVE